MFSANTSQVSNDVKYIEDFFSAWLRTGTGSSQTVTTGIKENTGALVISKSRSAATDWAWYDTFRGATKDLASNTTAAETTQSQGLTAFNTDGHTWGTLAKVNTSGATYVDFVLKPTPKFFDVVTYTGDGVDGRTVAHNLGSVPGCIIVKNTGQAQGWAVYHRSLSPTQWLRLETTNAASTFPAWADTAPTATVFSVGNTANTNAAGNTYVAYLFAHNAGGFGLTGTDNVISCGSYTGNGSASGPTVTLGYEPQWVLIKKATGTADNWILFDNMRGMPVGAASDFWLFPNSSAAEATGNTFIAPTATGFYLESSNSMVNQSSQTYIYIAIRRGPMKTPTSGTSVFSPQLEGGTAGTDITTNFPIDWQLIKGRASAQTTYGITRLTGVSTTTTEAAGYLLQTASTAAELADSTSTRYWSNTGFQVPSGFGGGSSTAYITENFRRAPGFFDVVCYTGTGSATTFNHNLGVAPELMITRSRSAIAQWYVYAAPLGNTKAIILNGNSTPNTGSEYWNNTTPTSSVFTVGVNSSVNGSGRTQVAYLFASCPGVSKIGTFTQTGSAMSIDCGFTSGARFILLKCTNSTGDWYVWDTARGITSSIDPSLSLNNTSAENTANDWITINSAGFGTSSDFAATWSSGTFIYLAIA